MTDDIRKKYLETEVQTATPQKLQKMLLDGALRFALAAQKATQEERFAEAQEAFDRCRSIISELLAGIRGEDELSVKVTSLYSFMLRSLIDLQHQYDESSMNDVIEVLEMERETWRMLCDKMPEAPEPITSAYSKDREITAQQATNILDGSQSANGIDLQDDSIHGGTSSMGRFSIDA